MRFQVPQHDFLIHGRMMCVSDLSHCVIKILMYGILGD